MNQNEVDGSLAGLAQQIEQGLDPYSVIGKLYVRTLAKDQALALAIQALQALMPKEEAKPAAPADIPVVTELPADAPEGAMVMMEVASDPVVPADSGVVTPGNDFGAKPKKTRRAKRA